MANCPKNKSAPQKAGLWGRRLSKIDEVPEKDAASTSEKKEVNACRGERTSKAHVYSCLDKRDEV